MGYVERKERDCRGSRRLIWKAARRRSCAVLGASVLALSATAQTCPVVPTGSEPADPPVEAVTVVGESSSLTIGGTISLTALVTDALGHVLDDRPVSWSSSNLSVAEVAGNGGTTAVVTGIAEGSATITASAEGRTGGAVMEVSEAAADTAAPPADTTSQPPATYPNEPAGLSGVSERGFDAKEELGWTATSKPNLTIVADASAPKSPANVAQMLYPAGCSDGCDPGWTERYISELGYTRLYVSFWVKISDNWQSHSSGGNKIGYIWMHDNPVLFPTIFGYESLHPEVRIQDVPGDGARNLLPNLADVEIVRGRWHRWELVVVGNSGGDPNGEIHWWVDGVKVGEYRDVVFGSATQSKVWQIIAWRPIWGGRGDTVAEDMFMWLDHLYASGAP